MWVESILPPSPILRNVTKMYQSTIDSREDKTTAARLKQDLGLRISCKVQAEGQCLILVDSPSRESVVG